MKMFIIIIVIAAALGLGYYVFSNSGGKVAVIEPVGDPQTQALFAAAETKTGAMYKCVDKTGTTMYLAPDKVRTEIVSKMGSTRVAVDYHLVRDDMSYTWATDNGKISFGASKSSTQSGTTAAAYYQAIPTYGMQGFECAVWTGGESIFNVPTSVNFIQKGY